jgi:2-dehydropantoate 2-reductase
MNGRIAILGAGAIGLYYGARLALAGRDVSFLARSDLTAIRERGITLKVEGREDVLKPAAVFARAEDIGPVDLVILTLKATANAELAHLLPPLLGPATWVLTLGRPRPHPRRALLHCLHAVGAGGGDVPPCGFDRAR